MRRTGKVWSLPKIGTVTCGRLKTVLKAAVFGAAFFAAALAFGFAFAFLDFAFFFGFAILSPWRRQKSTPRNLNRGFLATFWVQCEGHDAPLSPYEKANIPTNPHAFTALQQCCCPSNRQPLPSIHTHQFRTKDSAIRAGRYQENDHVALGKPRPPLQALACL